MTTFRAGTRATTRARYDPWADLVLRWPEIDIALEPMAGRLLGELRYPLIALRRTSSPAQLRCTLAHEIVHLDRGTAECGRWAAREEAAVHAEAARRLIGLDDLAEAAVVLGDDGGAGALAAALDVDTDTLRIRLDTLTRQERTAVRDVLSGRRPIGIARSSTRSQIGG